MQRNIRSDPRLSRPSLQLRYPRQVAASLLFVLSEIQQCAQSKGGSLDKAWFEERTGDLVCQIKHDTGSFDVSISSFIVQGTLPKPFGVVLYSGPGTPVCLSAINMNGSNSTPASVGDLFGSSAKTPGSPNILDNASDQLPDPLRKASSASNLDCQVTREVTGLKRSFSQMSDRDTMVKDVMRSWSVIKTGIKLSREMIEKQEAKGNALRKKLTTLEHELKQERARSSALEGELNAERHKSSIQQANCQWELDLVRREHRVAEEKMVAIDHELAMEKAVHSQAKIRMLRVGVLMDGAARSFDESYEKCRDDGGRASASVTQGCSDREDGFWHNLCVKDENRLPADKGAKEPSQEELASEVHHLLASER